MLKTIGAICVCVSGCAYGLRLVREIKERLLFYQSFGQCLQLIRGEIRFGCSTLPESFCALEKRTSSPVAPLFCQVGRQWLEQPEIPLGNIWSDKGAEYGKQYFLDKDELDWVCAIGSRLGHLDKEMQVSTIDMLLEELHQREEKVQGALKEKGRLYPCVGTMSGLLTALLLI